MAYHMTPDELKHTAWELMGRHWKAELARALDINPRTVYRWASGEIPVPSWVRVALRGIESDLKRG